MNLGPHAAFIVASYAISGVIVAALIGWITAEHRALKRKLADFDARGVTRRSAEPQGAVKNAVRESTA